MGIYNLYAGTVHPTLRRHKLGTLEKDVRSELIQDVKENDWEVGADIEFDKLARLPQFEGHNSNSLLKKYDSMLLATMKKLGAKNKRKVPVEEVEKWWNNSTRRAKKTYLIEKELQIVEAYYRVRQELGLAKKGK